MSAAPDYGALVAQILRFSYCCYLNAVLSFERVRQRPSLQCESG